MTQATVYKVPSTMEKVASFGKLSDQVVRIGSKIEAGIERTLFVETDIFERTYLL
jgi:hypothetical protein